MESLHNETVSFFDKVKQRGDLYTEVSNINSYNETLIRRWVDAYNYANNLEYETPNQIFLFSAQHKDCIILSIILTELYKSETIIWRTNDVIDTKIDENTQNRERDVNAVNMSGSISLLDWNKNESANSFLVGNSTSFVNKGACEKLLKSLKINNKLTKIINKYYNILELRYLCVFEFNDDQLKNYVRLTEEYGRELNIVDIKKEIKEIKKQYTDNESYNSYTQCRILTTTPNSENPYLTYILEPNDNNNYSKMKEEIKQVIGGSLIKKYIKQSKRKQSKRKQ